MKERKAENACNGVKHCLKNRRAARGKGRGKKERGGGEGRENGEKRSGAYGEGEGYILLLCQRTAS